MSDLAELKHIALYITHNDHRAVYTSVAQALEQAGASEGADAVRASFPSRAEMHNADESRVRALLAIRDGELWEIQWYPRTPIGSFTVRAASFERALEHALKIQRQEEKSA